MYIPTSPVLAEMDRWHRLTHPKCLSYPVQAWSQPHKACKLLLAYLAGLAAANGDRDLSILEHSVRALSGE